VQRGEKIDVDVHWDVLEPHEEAQNKDGRSETMYSGLSTPPNGTPILGGDEFPRTSGCVSSSSSLKDIPVYVHIDLLAPLH
jgi:hypothetical protein